jgi:hypothetical protein
MLKKLRGGFYPPAVTLQAGEFPRECGDGGLVRHGVYSASCRRKGNGAASEEHSL